LAERERRETLSIHSDPVLIRDVRRWVGSIAREAGFDDDQIHQVTLALSEVCSNVHRHSYGGRTDGRIDLQAEVDGRRLRLTVRDYGVPFRHRGYTPRGFSEPSEAGYGLLVAQELMDEVEYKDTGSGTLVMMTKSRSLPSSRG
jgi:serine/threonine-protein kinase RsbW